MAAKVGFGDKNAWLKVYIANPPPLTPYQNRASIEPLQAGELAVIVEACGNHWRKIFNCYAKLAQGLNSQGFERWQDYRDQILLQKSNGGTGQQLRFDRNLEELGITIICGKTHAATFVDLNGLSVLNLEWLDNDFALGVKAKVIVCPYFDYRQLSNVKIERLIELVESLR